MISPSRHLLLKHLHVIVFYIHYAYILTFKNNKITTNKTPEHQWSPLRRILYIFILNGNGSQLQSSLGANVETN